MSLTEEQISIANDLAAQYHENHPNTSRTTREILSYAHAIECILILEGPNGKIKPRRIFKTL